jgi:hypothetical protein
VPGVREGMMVNKHELMVIAAIGVMACLVVTVIMVFLESDVQNCSSAIRFASINDTIQGNKITVLLQPNFTGNVSYNLSWFKYVPDDFRIIGNKHSYQGLVITNDDTLRINDTIDNMNFVPSGNLYLVFERLNSSGLCRGMYVYRPQEFL